MLDKILYLHLLILCGIWTQGIIGTNANEEINKTSDLLIREKRVTNRIPDQDIPVEIKDIPYIVHIKFGMRIHCVGSILSHQVVITIASCVGHEASRSYFVVSASPRSNRGTRHDIIEVKKHFGNYPNRPLDGIAFLTVDPFFQFGVYTNKIELHSGPLLQGMVGTVSGWGYNCRDQDRGTSYPLRLRKIEVPIMAHGDCVNRYRGRIEISEMDICTFDWYKQCGHNDGGAPLVVDGYLAGVHLWSGLTRQHDSNYPDVYIMLQHSAYIQWIRTNVRDTHIRFQHLNN